MKWKTMLAGVLCAALLTATLAGCNGEGGSSAPSDDNNSAVTTTTTAAPKPEQTPEELYETALESMEEIESLDMGMTMKMTISGGDESQDINMTYDMKTQKIDDATLNMELSSSTVIPGLDEPIESKFVYVDGWLYVLAMNEKGKMEMDLPTAQDTIESSMDLSAMTDMPQATLLKDIKEEKQGDDTVISYTMDGAEMGQQMGDMLNALLGSDETSMSNVTASGTLTVDKDNMVKSMTMKLGMTANIDGADTAIDIETTTTVKAVNSDVVVNAPADADTYPEMAF